MNNTAKKKRPRTGCWIVGLGFLALFILTTVGTGMWLCRLRQHHLFVERLEENSFDIHFNNKPTWTEQLIRDVAGEKAFAEIENVHLNGTHGKADLYCVSQLRGVKFLEVQGKHFKDADFASIGQTRDLVDITLSDLSVSKPGLVELKHCGNLRTVSALGNWLDDKALAGLCEATQIESLYLENAAITDKGLNELTALTRLNTLTLANCKGLSRSGFRQLAGMRALESLILENTPVNAVDMACLDQLREISIHGTSWSRKWPEVLVEMKSVEALLLSCCTVTDDDLGRIAKMKNLKTLILDHVDVSVAGLMQLLKHQKLESVTVYLTSSKWVIVREKPIENWDPVIDAFDKQAPHIQIEIQKRHYLLPRRRHKNFTGPQPFPEAILRAWPPPLEPKSSSS